MFDSTPTPGPPDTQLPRLHRSLDRPRLREQLNAALRHPPDFSLGFGHRLTLVCGPAGFGKTTLIADWLRDAQTGDSAIDIAWLSLEATDNDPAHLTASLLSRLEPDSLAPAIPPTPLWPTLGNRLLAGMAARTRPLILVIDDYHLIEESIIHEFMELLIERLPANTHLILISRADPPLPLGRLRAAREMGELRARDLRFTPVEVEAFINRFMGLSLSPQDVALLERRTEGWVAGLQLAAYSLGHEKDPTAFLAAFAGDDRYIADYLMEEVLSRQPAERQSFLLQTSILDRLTPDLCNAVTGRSDGRAMLHSLETGNLFLTPLDNRRQWYRYHGLFADLLRERLEESNQDIAALHRHAASWLLNHGMLPEAVDHALEAKDVSLAMDLMILAAPQLFIASRLSRLTRWSTHLPDPALRQRPRLLLALAWAWVATGEPEKSEHYLHLFEAAVGHRAINLCNPDEHLTTKELTPETTASLAEAAAISSRLMVNRLEIDEAIHLCRCTLRRLDSLAANSFREETGPANTLPDRWPLYYNIPAAIRPVLLFNLGLAQKFLNETAAATDTLLAAAEAAQTQRNSHLVALAFGHLAELQRIHGQWRSALATCSRGLEIVRRLTGELPPLSGLLLAEEGVTRYELGEISTAEQLWLQAVELAEPWGNWETLLPAYIGIARLRGFMRRDSDGAREALIALRELTHRHADIVFPLADAYERMLAPLPIGDPVRPLAALPITVLPYLRERQLLCELHALLPIHRHLPEVVSRAAAQATQAQSAGRLGNALHFHILHAASLNHLGRADAARDPLNRALAIARPDGVTVPFSEGELGQALPFTTDGREPVHSPAAGLLDLGPDKGLLEIPSQREQEVLRLIAAGLSNKEIGERIFVTEGTVKNHAHSLYGKLSVTNRTQAIARARELGLL